MTDYPVITSIEDPENTRLALIVNKQIASVPLLGIPGMSALTFLASGLVGSIFDYAGTAAPSGFLLCFGQSLAVATYPALFAVVGYTYGGAGANFNLPDYRGRVGAGQDDMGGTSANRLTSPLNGDTLGAAGGAEGVTLALTDIPAHDHGGSTTGNGTNHTHTTDSFLATGGAAVGLVRTAAGSGAAVNFSTNNPTAHTHTIASAGGGGAHSNVQPTIILNKIIYAGV